MEYGRIRPYSCIGFLKGFAFYQFKRGPNAGLFRDSNARLSKSGSIQSVHKPAASSRQIYCNGFIIRFQQLKARLWRYSLRALPQSFSAIAGAALALFVCVMCFSSGKICCVRQVKSVRRNVSTTVQQGAAPDRFRCARASLHFSGG
jgi:hypothetical protein